MAFSNLEFIGKEKLIAYSAFLIKEIKSFYAMALLRKTRRHLNKKS
jgi:hypothetical protein